MKTVKDLKLGDILYKLRGTCIYEDEVVSLQRSGSDIYLNNYKVTTDNDGEVYCEGSRGRQTYYLDLGSPRLKECLRAGIERTIKGLEDSIKKDQEIVENLREGLSKIKADPSSAMRLFVKCG